MARLVVEESALSRFLDELPGLMMQYKQMQYAQEERSLERQDRKAAVAQQVLLKEYYDKKSEVRQFEKMFDKYDNLSAADVSQGGADIINIVDEQNNIDMDAITQNLEALGSYQSDLESSLGELRGQAQTLQKMQLHFAGPEGVLQQHEYEEFREHALAAMDEGGLGWKTTAGADVEFYKKDPTTRRLEAMKVTEHLQKEATVGAEGHYAILQGIFTPREGEDAGDIADRLTYEVGGQTIEPSEEVIAAIQSIAGQSYDYDAFLTNLNAYPAASGGDAIRAELASNLNTSQVFNNLKRNADLITTLDNELAGINEPAQVTDFENFVSDVSGVTNPEALFGLYDQAIAGKDPALHDKFFNAIEAQLGGVDAGEAYMRYKGFYDPQADPQPVMESELQIAIDDLRNKQKVLSGAGFYNTPEYESITDSLTVLSRDLRERENYRTFTENIEKRMAEGVLSEDELSELSSVVNISVEDLRRMIREKHQKEMTRAQSTRRSFYETGMQE